MKFMKKKVLKCLRVIKNVDIGLLRPATLPLVIAEVIAVVRFVEVDLGHKRLAYLPLAIM